MSGPVILLDSITDARESARGEVAVSGSHGGLYAATVASRAGLRAAVFNDAGVGFDDAGVAGVHALARVGMAAAAAACASCRIGIAEDTLSRGRISVVNAVARDLGVEPGQTVAAAADCLAEAPAPSDELPAVVESRRAVDLGGRQQVWLLDSASLVSAEDAGRLLVTGSHGGLVGGDPKRGLKAPARVAVFNDAGVGIEKAGIARLAVLDTQDIAAVAVDCMTARIGDAASALETGVISHANTSAERLGARPGLTLKVWLADLA